MRGPGSWAVANASTPWDANAGAASVGDAAAGCLHRRTVQQAVATLVPGNSADPKCAKLLSQRAETHVAAA